MEEAVGRITRFAILQHWFPQNWPNEIPYVIASDQGPVWGFRSGPGTVRGGEGGSHTTPLKGDGFFKAHSTRETLKEWVPPFTMRSAYEVRDLFKVLSQRTPGFKSQEIDAGVTSLIIAKSPPRGLYFYPCPLDYKDGCPSQKRSSLLQAAEQGPNDLQSPVLPAIKE